MRNWWNFNEIKENSIPLSEILMGTLSIHSIKIENFIEMSLTHQNSR